MMNQRNQTTTVSSMHIFKDDSRCRCCCKATTTTTTPVMFSNTSMPPRRTILRLLLPVVVVATLAITSTSNVNAFVVTTPLLNANGGGAGASSSAAAEQHYYSGGISSKIGSGIISTIASNPPSLQHPPSKQLLENSSAAARGGGRYGRRRSTENLLVLTNRLLKQEHDYNHYGIHSHGASPFVTTTVMDRVDKDERNTRQITNDDNDDTIVLPVPKTKPVPKFETQVQNVVVLPEHASIGAHDQDASNTGGAQHSHYTYSLEDSDPHQVLLEKQLKYDALSNKVATPSLSKLMSSTTTTKAPVASAQSNVNRALEPLGFESTTDDVLRYLKYYKAFGTFVEDGTAVVTDGTSIMGCELVLGLVKSNLSNVVVCTNDIESARQMRSQIRKLHGKEYSSKIFIQYMDLSDLISVRDASHEISSKFSSIDILCNNASVNLGDATGAASSDKTAQGLDYQMGINHVAHYYLTTQLLPFLSDQGRVVTATSTAFRSVKPQHLRNSPLFRSDDSNGDSHDSTTPNPYIHYGRQEQHRAALAMDPWKSYTQSKLANLLFAKELQQRFFSSTDMTSVAVHPGIMGLSHGGSTNKEADDKDDVYCGIDLMPSTSSESSSSASLLMESLCDTMTCKTPSEAASTILFGCLAASAAQEEDASMSLIKGGDLLVDCQPTNNEDNSSLVEQTLYQKVCWKNTQTLIDQVLLSNQNNDLKP